MTKKQTKTIDVLEMTNDLRKMLTEHTKLLLDQYRKIKGIYGDQSKVMMDAVMQFLPDGTKQFFQAFDSWLDGQMLAFEKNLDDAFQDSMKSIHDLEFTAPNMEHFEMLVGEYTRLWKENYKKLKTRRDQASQESFETLKKMFPVVVHPILENANKWINEQNERFENELLENIGKQILSLNIEDD